MLFCQKVSFPAIAAVVWSLDNINTIIINFTIQTQNGCTRCTHQEKICDVNNF